MGLGLLGSSFDLDSSTNDGRALDFGLGMSGILFLAIWPSFRAFDERTRTGFSTSLESSEEEEDSSITSFELGFVTGGGEDVKSMISSGATIFGRACVDRLGLLTGADALSDHVSGLDPHSDSLLPLFPLPFVPLSESECFEKSGGVSDWELLADSFGLRLTLVLAEET